MQSNIDPTTIDATFPVVDNNQPSQGFRTNFSSIKTGLVTAKSEITNLQTTYIQVVGDVTSDPNDNQALGQEDGVITLNLSLNLGDNGNGSGGSYDSQKNRITFDYSSSGLLKNVSVSDTGIYTAYDTSGEINWTTNESDPNNPSLTGIASLQIPSITTDTFGNVSGISSKTVTFPGLLGYNMPNNSVLIGSSSGKSTSIESSSDNQLVIRRNGNIVFDNINMSDISNISGTPTNGEVLVYNGTNWIPTMFGGGTVTGVSAGPGLKITNPSSVAEIDFDYPSLSDIGTLSSTNIFVVYDGTNYKISTIGEIYNFVNSTTTLDFSKLSENNNKPINTLDFVVYDKSNGTSYRLPANDIFQNYSSTIFISNSGDDTNGDGSFINPYQTISKGISSLGNNANIILFPGTYSEIIQLPDINVTISSLIDNTSTINGSIIQTSTSSLNFTLKNINLVSNNSTILTFIGNNAAIAIENCNMQNYTSYNTITSSGNILSFEIKNCYITGILNLSHNCDTLIKNITSSNSIGVGFVINYTQPENNTVNYIIDNIDYVSSIQHASGNLYVSNIENFVNLNTFVSSSSVSTDILSIKNVNGKIITDTQGETCITFSKTGTCDYYVENFDINYSNLRLDGSPVSFKSNQWQYDYVTTLDNNGNSNLTIDAYSKTTVVSCETNGTITINMPADLNYRIEMSLVLTIDGATALTFGNINWLPTTPVLNYTSGYQNIITLVYIPGNTSWLGWMEGNSSEISSDSSNLITMASDGLLVSSSVVATKSNLASYLPLTGGTITGDLITTSSVNFNGPVNSINLQTSPSDTPGSCGTAIPNTIWIDNNYASKASLTSATSGSSLAANIDISATSGNILVRNTDGLFVNGSSLATETWVNGNFANLAGGFTVNSSFTVNGDITANNFDGTASSAKLADLAEIYETDNTYSIGTIVSIGGEKEITLCTDGNKIFGIISQSPGFLLNSDSDGLPVALIGKTPVRLVGQISKGDPIGFNSNGVASLWTTSSQGKVIGTSLEDSNIEDEKLIKCFVRVEVPNV